MAYIDESVIDMMANEAARVIRDKKRIIRKQQQEIRALSILTVCFIIVSIAAALTLLFA